MGIEKFNPFKRDRQNFPGVVIPLADAPTRPKPALTDDEKKTDDANKSLERASSSENGSSGGSVNEPSHRTIESLRAEVESDIAASAHDSVYDRMLHSHSLYLSPKRQIPPLPCYSEASGLLVQILTSSIIGKAKVINCALMDIGMGRYQWQLFFLCGFGWLADK